MASFPTSVKSFTSKVDGVDYPQAVHVNDLQDEVNAIETDIGTTAAGGVNVFKRINNLTVTSAPVLTSDYLGIYSSSDATAYKVLGENVGGYVLYGYFGLGANPADATTYYFSPYPLAGLMTSAASHKIRFPRAGVLRRVYIEGLITGTLGTTETSTISFRLNDTTDTTITSTAAFNATPFSISNTSMTVTIAAGDYGTLKWATPTWVTNPTGVSMVATLWIA
jgi:hypothetical protein